MSLDFAKLVAQGRAKAMGVCWNEKELEALVTLERERKLSRVIAADYIRNSIMTVEDYDAAKANEFKPLSISEAQTETDNLLKERGKEAIGKGKYKTSKREKEL